MNTAEVLNTPGYYYAIAYALSVFVIACTNERKLGRWKLAAVSCVQFALLLFFMTETDGVRQELFIPSMMVIVGLLLGYIYICNDFSFKEAGFYCVKAFINGEFAASMCWQIYYYLRYVRGMDGEHWRWVELVLVYAVIFAILTLIELNLKKDLEELHITRRELLVVIIIAASVFAMSNLSYLDQNGLFSGSFVMDIFIIGVIVYFYKEILAVSYDSEFATLRGINVKFFYTLILILAALCVVAAIKAVGLILVIALLTIPTYLAESFASRLSTMMIISSILATIFTILGLIISYLYDISSGASIIMVAVVVLGIVKLIKLKK